ncbi:MAG: ABC transporter permease [Lachnospiraceae bacterium]|nr:ABC transporter permease [Lachnospiraceae bacterium]MDD3794385.1 ABC transporter permease [Lachnospiraceae bacterium]
MAKENQAALTIQEEFAKKIKAENRREKVIRWAPVLVLVALIIFFTIARGTAFASVSNLVAVLNQWSIPLLVALGLTFVIMLGSIDLSIDGTVGMAGSIASVLVMNTLNGNNFGIFGIIAAILCSVAVGFVIGLIHVKLKVPSFMVTFAFQNICIGIAYITYSGTPATVMDPLLKALPKASFLGIPFITWVALIMLALCIYIQEFTPFGRHIYAVGTDETIPRSVGINVDLVKIKVFTFAGFLFGVAGVVGMIRLGQGQAGIGKDLMFPAQAAVVIGGTSLAGGKGGVINTVVGTLIMTVLINGLTMMGVDPNIKTGIQGIIILVAVILTIKRGATVISK